MSTFGETLRKRRETLGLSVEDAVERHEDRADHWLALDKDQIKSIEGDAPDLSVEAVQEYAATLGLRLALVPVDDNRDKVREAALAVEREWAALWDTPAWTIEPDDLDDVAAAIKRLRETLHNEQESDR